MTYRVVLTATAKVISAIILFGKRAGAFRVLFEIGSEEVRILHIRRAAMSQADSTETDPPPPKTD